MFTVGERKGANLSAGSISKNISWPSCVILTEGIEVMSNIKSVSCRLHPRGWIVCLALWLPNNTSLFNGLSSEQIYDRNWITSCPGSAPSCL